LDIQIAKQELIESKRPIYFFDDDPDGLSSFLQFYKFKKEGKGLVIKSSPELRYSFLRKVEEYSADRVFILDKPMVSKQFIDECPVKIIWIDHHEPTNITKENLIYLNPRVKDHSINKPVSEISYEIFKENLWIAMMGAVGDWTLPKFSKEFSEKYPDLLAPDITDPAKALFSTELGNLIKIISFVLKGKSQDVNRAIKVLIKIDSPYEILHQTTSKGKLIYRHYSKLNEEYSEHIENAKKQVKNPLKEAGDEHFLFYFYDGAKTSFTKEISNELLFLHPEKLILVGRKANGFVKMSVRSSVAILPLILEKTLKNFSGSSSGGHEHACGAHIKEQDLSKFIKELKKNYIDSLKKPIIDSL